jgi:hypothetical protein
MSSTEPAPAAMPATMQPTFVGAFTPQSPPGRTSPLSAHAARPALPDPSPGPGWPCATSQDHRTWRQSSRGHETIVLTRCPLEPRR